MPQHWQNLMIPHHRYRTMPQHWQNLMIPHHRYRTMPQHWQNLMIPHHRYGMTPLYWQNLMIPHHRYRLMPQHWQNLMIQNSTSCPSPSKVLGFSFVCFLQFTYQFLSEAVIEQMQLLTMPRMNLIWIWYSQPIYFSEQICRADSTEDEFNTVKHYTSVSRYVELTVLRMNSIQSNIILQ